MNNHNPTHYLLTVISVLIKAISSSLAWLALSLIGLLLLSNRIMPWDLLIGLPLLLIAGGMVVNNLTGVLLAAFLPYYNQGICRLCKEKSFKNHQQVKELLKTNN